HRVIQLPQGHADVGRSGGERERHGGGGTDDQAAPVEIAVDRGRGGSTARGIDRRAGERGALPCDEGRIAARAGGGGVARHARAATGLGEARGEKAAEGAGRSLERGGGRIGEGRGERQRRVRRPRAGGIRGAD